VYKYFLCAIDSSVFVTYLLTFSNDDPEVLEYKVATSTNGSEIIHYHRLPVNGKLSFPVFFPLDWTGKFLFLPTAVKRFLLRGLLAIWNAERL